MDSQDVGSNGGFARTYASLRQQQEEFQRRLMRPGPIPGILQGHNGDPMRTEGVEAAGFLASFNDGTRSDPQWAFQTPQVYLSACLIPYIMDHGRWLEWLREEYAEVEAHATQELSVSDDWTPSFVYPYGANQTTTRGPRVMTAQEFLARQYPMERNSTREFTALGVGAQEERRNYLPSSNTSSVAGSMIEEEPEPIEDDVDENADGDENHGVDDIEDHEEEQGEDEEDHDEDHDEEDPPFDASAVGLKEISNLASFTVSSYKPGCGVKELRDDDVNQFWQSDGPQPHRLNIHFIKRVEIRVLRLYLDYELDESYTPTKIQITAGFSPNFTIPFTTMELNVPKGWIDVPIAGAGGGPDGNSLSCYFLRFVILENHQNGKDTHIRGIKVYALDDAADTAENNPLEEVIDMIDDNEFKMAQMDIHDHDEEAMARLAEKRKEQKAKAKKFTPSEGGLSIPDFMREPEIR